jgi:proline iminopeptidase
VMSHLSVVGHSRQFDGLLMTSGLLPGTDIARAPGKTRLDLGSLNSSRALPSTPFMEAHYFQNDCFMTPDQLMNEAEKLTGIPGVMVQGRYDLLCPPATSHRLAARWPNSEVRIVEGAGHILYDPGVRDAVMKAIADLAGA